MCFARHLAVTIVHMLAMECHGDSILEDRCKASVTLSIVKCSQQQVGQQGHDGVGRPILDEAGHVNYELSDAEYAANEVEDTWVQGLLAGLGAYLNTLQPLLTPANYEQLVSLSLEKVIIVSWREL